MNVLARRGEAGVKVLLIIDCIVRLVQRSTAVNSQKMIPA